MAGAIPPPRRAAAAPDTIAPDGSEIRLLAGGEELATSSSLVEVRLGSARVTVPVSHRTIEETWHILEGSGQVWRSLPGGEARVDQVAPGDTLVIPAGCSFQFSAGSRGLRFICFTAPPWPGPDEARILNYGGLDPHRPEGRSPGS